MAEDFSEVTNAEFESIMRRSCVIKIFARFFDQVYLESHLPEHEQFGIFARRPDLPELFQQPRFAAAFNRVQHAFEEKNGEISCRNIIVNFCRNGGDHGVTEAFMRDSCHLTRKPLLDKEDAAIVRVAGVEVDVERSAAICKRPQPVCGAFRSFSIALMKEMCDDGFDYMTKVKFFQRKRHVEGSSLNREELFDRLIESKMWVFGEPEQKAKIRIRPCINTTRNLEELLVYKVTASESFPEVFDTTFLSHRSHGVSIDANASIVTSCLQELLTVTQDRGSKRKKADVESTQEPREEQVADRASSSSSSKQTGRGVGSAKQGRGKVKPAEQKEEAEVKPAEQKEEAEVKPNRRGRHTQAQRNEREKLDEKHMSLKYYDEKLRAICATMAHEDTTKVHDPIVGVRRLKRKTTEETGFSISVTYRQCRPWLSRDMACGPLAAQQLPQSLQVLAFPNTMDLDIKNAMPTITLQLLQHLHLDQDVLHAFKDEMELLEVIVSDREGCCEILDASSSVGKDLIIKGLAGQKIVAVENDHEEADAADLHFRSSASSFMKVLQRLSRFLRWVAMSCLDSKTIEVLKNDTDVKWLDGSAFAHFWQMAESYILNHWCDYARGAKFSHLSKAFDGMRISKSRVLHCLADLDEEENKQHFIMSSVEYIAQLPVGFQVAIIEKEHLDFAKILTRYALHNPDCAAAQPLPIAAKNTMLMAGNCIPAACAHFSKQYQEVCDAISVNTPPNVEVKTTRVRSYRQASRLLGVTLHPCLEVNLKCKGNWLLHVGGFSEAHCYPMTIIHDNQVEITWGEQTLTMGVRQLEDMMNRSVEKNHIHGFFVEGPLWLGAYRCNIPLKMIVTI